MREVFEHVLQCPSSLDAVQKRTIDVLRRVREDLHYPRLGYVAGVISSDGPEHIERNIGTLLRHTMVLRAQQPMPLFCASEIFTPFVYENLPEMELPHTEREQRFNKFWRGVLESGHITDVFLTPGWERSRGASEEYYIAKELGLSIHIVQMPLHVPDEVFTVK